VGWWVNVKAILWIAYSNKKELIIKNIYKNTQSLELFTDL
jgi:hypothetical protein